MLAKKEAYEGTDIIAGLSFLLTQVGPLSFLYFLPVQSSHAYVARESPLNCSSAQGMRSTYQELVNNPSETS